LIEFYYIDNLISDQAMFRVYCEKGEVIIREGEFGEYFYIVESGRLDVYVQKGTVNVNTNDPKFAGSTFGANALLYNAPRNATVISSEPSEIWAVLC
jgi:CRP-like cAMP-binding protein